MGILGWREPCLKRGSWERALPEVGILGWREPCLKRGSWEEALPVVGILSREGALPQVGILDRAMPQVRILRKEPCSKWDSWGFKPAATRSRLLSVWPCILPPPRKDIGELSEPGVKR